MQTCPECNSKAFFVGVMEDQETGEKFDVYACQLCEWATELPHLEMAEN